MTKKELMKKVLEGKGIRVQIDDDGDMFFRWELKLIYIFAEEDDPYENMVLAPFHQIDNDNVVSTLLLCNKLTRELRVAKVFANAELESVSASYQFILEDEETGKTNVDLALSIFSVINSLFASENLSMEEATSEDEDEEEQKTDTDE